MSHSTEYSTGLDRLFSTVTRAYNDAAWRIFQKALVASGSTPHAEGIGRYRYEPIQSNTAGIGGAEMAGQIEVVGFFDDKDQETRTKVARSLERLAQDTLRYSDVEDIVTRCQNVAMLDIARCWSVRADNHGAALGNVMNATKYYNVHLTDDETIRSITICRPPESGTAAPGMGATDARKMFGRIGELAVAIGGPLIAVQIPSMIAEIRDMSAQFA